MCHNFISNCCCSKRHCFLSFPKHVWHYHSKWNGCKVVLRYEPIIICNEKELCDELGASWAKKVSSEWRSMKKPERITRNPISYMFSRVSCRLLILVYSIQMCVSTVCQKRLILFTNGLCPKVHKTKHFESLYLLPAFKLLVKNSKEYDGKIKLLEKWHFNSWTY